MRRLPDVTPFTREQARALGWTDASLTRAIKRGELVRLRRGFFARAERLDDRARAVAAASALAAGVVSHRSALAIHGLPVISRPTHPEITVPPNGRGSAVDAHLHRASLPPEHVVSVDGVAVTSVARSLLDVGRSCPVHTAVAAMDAALHRELATIDELYLVSVSCWNWPGIRRAHRAMRAVDARAESPLESVSRLVLRWLAVAEPEPQVRVLDQFGREIGRLDFYWERFGVFGEADGRSKYDARDVLTAEKLRQEELESTGLIGVRWGWTDITRYPRVVKYRIGRAFERGQARDRSGFPREWSILRP
jgi:Transcriptional regulator, AbiEi antitoxin